MAERALLILAGLFILAYLLEVLGRRFRIPAVVLLIATGMAAREVLDRAGLELRFVEPLLPLVGTIGLILIVLEGALDLELRRERALLIARSSSAALAGFVVTLAAFAWLFGGLLGYDWPVAALAAMPFAVISSAVAIPGAAGLPDDEREFVVYESSLSDIIGVLVFYAWLAAGGSVDRFLADLVGGGALSLAAAVAAALGIFFLINRIEGHVRFVPLLAGLLLLYAAGKMLHLSPLILILVCGLLLNNPHLLEWNARLRAMHRPRYDSTLSEFKGLVAELTFAVKSVFFIMLGYWTDVREMTDWRAWAIALTMIGVVYSSRLGILRLLRVRDPRRLVWLAPRGLITVLLFLAASETGQLQDFPFGAVMIVVLATATATGLSHRAREPKGPANALNSTADRP
jgi:Kef-type K+ transport system membrane component KefB